jgi:hypothetical protein
MKPTMRASGPLMPLLGALGAMLLPSCSGSPPDEVLGDGGIADVGLPDGYVPIPKTAKCTGDKSACLWGTVSLRDFRAPPTASKVSLFRLFPHGNAVALQWAPVALDGTFAFSGLPAWGHYFLQAEGRFGSMTNPSSVASVAGSFSVPSAQEPIALTLRPVFLEVLQQSTMGQSSLLAWASAHLYDPSTGVELTTGAVSLTANGTTTPMTYGSNAGGTESFFVALPLGTTGGTSFTITTSSPALGPAPLSWTLAGEPATFQGAITSPTGAVSTGAPLAVTWTAQPMASYSVTELFFVDGQTFVPRYVSPTVNAPDVTSETIPASAITTPGTYALNESYSNATCPITADGCVYNVSTAAENVTAH